MAASLVLAGRAVEHKDTSACGAVEACIGRYAALMRAFAQMPLLETMRFQVHRVGLAKPVHDALAKAERATPMHTLEQLDEARAWRKKATRIFKELAPMLTRVTGAKAAAAWWARWVRIARRWSRSGNICSRFTSPSMWHSKWWGRVRWG